MKLTTVATHCVKLYLRYALVFMGLLTVAACIPPGKLTAVVITKGEVCDTTTTNGLCGTALLDPVTIEVRGEGVCSEFKLDLGIGRFPLIEKNFDFGKGPKVYQQLYFSSGWPGPKTVTAEGTSNCVGKVTTGHHVFITSGSFREDLRISVNLPNQLCYAVPSAAPRPALRPNTTVKITSPANPKVNFGCSFNGCIYDADGKPGSSAPARFPFPGLREYSLVLQVGNQAAQGGTATQFITNQTGDLSICFNDDNYYNNTGGWQVNIFVDESRAN